MDHRLLNDIFQRLLRLEAHTIRIECLENDIMTVLSDFIDQQKAHNTRLDTAITDLSADIQSLNDQIATLKAAIVEPTADETQAMADLTAAGEALAIKAEALDALTPPVAPPAA